MIDRVLIDRAVGASVLLRNIDDSWREYVESQEKYTFRLPFEGEYTCKVKGDKIYVEGYRGDLLIDKLYDGLSTYQLIKPIEHRNYALYGIYTKSAEFVAFSSEPTIGCHYLGIDSGGYRHICTGDLRFEGTGGIEQLRVCCGAIMRSFRGINITSLGGVYMPDGHERFGELLNRGDMSWRDRIALLTTEGYIKPLMGVKGGVSDADRLDL
jgi:hypothetical protein